MNLYTAHFFKKFSKDLIYIKSNKIEKIKKEIVDQIFYKEDVSYLPILTNLKGHHIGTISRKKYFYELLEKKEFNPIKLNDTSVRTVNIEDNIREVLEQLNISSGLILKENNEFTKFISPRSVSNSFQDYSTKLFLIESVEMKIREFITVNKIDFINPLAEKNQHYILTKKELKKIDDLSFNDYNLIFNSMWENFNFYNKPISKSDFLNSLNQVSMHRNDWFHFRNKINFSEKPFKTILKYLNF